VIHFAEGTRRNIALRLFPFLFILYITNYLDRACLAYAALGEVPADREEFGQSWLFNLRSSSPCHLGSDEGKTGKRQPIFLASLGPGLLFGGGWLVPKLVPRSKPQ
jgi:hypothetical protein